MSIKVETIQNKIKLVEQAIRRLEKRYKWAEQIAAANKHRDKILTPHWQLQRSLTAKLQTTFAAEQKARNEKQIKYLRHHMPYDISTFGFYINNLHRIHPKMPYRGDSDVTEINVPQIPGLFTMGARQGDYSGAEKYYAAWEPIDKTGSRHRLVGFLLVTTPRHAGDEGEARGMLDGVHLYQYSPKPSRKHYNLKQVSPVRTFFALLGRRKDKKAFKAFIDALPRHPYRNSPLRT